MRVYWKRIGVAIGFTIPVALLIAGTVVTQSRLSGLIADHHRSGRTGVLLFDLEKAESLLKDAETAQRGYLYTGDAKYLGLFEQARAQITPNIDTLARLVADNPSQQESIADLRNLSQSKLTELKRAIETYQTGNRDDARAIVLSNRGAALMSHVREIIDTMESRDVPLESHGPSQFDRNIQATISWIYLFSAVAIAGLALAAYFVLRDLNLRKKQKTEIPMAQDPSATSTSTT